MSEIRANTIANAAGTGPADLTGQWAAKAFVVYNQITVNVDKSENVSSITDDAAGTYTANFTNALSASDEIAIAGAVITGGTGRVFGAAQGSFTASSIEVRTTGNAALSYDDQISSALVNGDLA